MAFTVVTISHDVKGNTNLESLRSFCSTYWPMVTPPCFWSLYWLPFYQEWGRFQWVKHERRQETNENENQLKERKKETASSKSHLLALSDALYGARACLWLWRRLPPPFATIPAPPSGSPWAPPTLSLPIDAGRPARPYVFLLFPLFLLQIIVCSLFQLFSFFLSLLATSP